MTRALFKVLLQWKGSYLSKNASVPSQNAWPNGGDEGQLKAMHRLLLCIEDGSAPIASLGTYNR